MSDAPRSASESAGQAEVGAQPSELSGGDPAAALRAEREARIAQLEARERRPRGLGVHPVMALMGLCVCLFLLWQERLDLAYLLAPRTPTTLGAAGGYQLEGLTPNRYVQVHGQPTSKASYGEVDGRVVVMVGLEGTPFVVRRPPLPGEHWRPGRAAPAPNPSPFAVRGRLLRADQDPAFREGYAAFDGHAQLREVDGTLWGIIEGQRPGAQHGAAAWAVVLSTLLLFNLWLLARGIQVRLLRRRLARDVHVSA